MNHLQSPRRRPAVLRDAQPHGRDRARARHPRRSPTRIRSSRATAMAAQAPPRGDQRRVAHALLRRLLALGLSRGRRRQRATRRWRACASGCPRERALRGLDQPPAPAARRPRVPLPRLHGLPRPRRSSPSVLGAACAVVRDASGARALPAQRLPRRPGVPLADAVRALVAERTGQRARPARSGCSTHLRCFGHCFNPVSFYYCFDARRRAPGGGRRRGDEHAVGRAPRLRPGARADDGAVHEARRQGLPRLAVHGHGPRATTWRLAPAGRDARGARSTQPRGRRRAFDASSARARRRSTRARPAPRPAPPPGADARDARAHLRATPLRLKLKGAPYFAPTRREAPR